MWENERITAVFWGYLTIFAFSSLIFAVFGVFYVRSERHEQPAELSCLIRVMFWKSLSGYESRAKSDGLFDGDCGFGLVGKK